MNAQLGLEGRYKFTKHKADAEGNVIPGTEQLVLDWFDNLLTNTGLDLLGTSDADNLVYCRLGTGNTAPAFTDSNLVAQVGSTNTAGIGGASGLSVDTTYLYRRVSKRFAAGSVANVNLAEVGMSNQATGNNIFSRSLLKDTGGNPTTITLAPDEVLDVVYELRMYLPAQDIVVAATIDGVATNVTMRYNTHATTLANNYQMLGAGLRGTPANPSQPQYTSMGTVGETLLAASAAWAGTNPGAGYTWTLQAYVPGSFTTKFNISVPLTNGNFATGLGALYIGAIANGDSRGLMAMPGFGFGFNPKLNKTASRTATAVLGVTWGRYTP